MSPGTSRSTTKSCGGEIGCKPGLKQPYPVVLMPQVPGSACPKQSEATSPLPKGQEDEICKDGNVEKLLDPETPDVPPAAGKGRCRRVWDKVCELHSPCAFILAVLVALVVALVVAVSVLAARKQEECAAPVLSCPYGWVGYRRVCYYLSEEEGSWEWSQEQCSSLGASLVVLKTKQEMEFLWRLRGNFDYWIGLRRQGKHLEWVDGSSFNQTILAWSEDDCMFLSDHAVASLSCSQPQHYLCSKPEALVGQS